MWFLPKLDLTIFFLSLGNSRWDSQTLNPFGTTDSADRSRSSPSYNHTMECMFWRRSRVQQCTVDEWSCDDTTIESCVGGARFQLYLLPSPPLPSSPSRPLYSSFFSALPPSDPSSYSTPCSLLYSASPFYPSQSLPVFLHLKLYHMYITLLPLLFCSLPSSPPFYATSHACIVRTDYRMSVVRSTAAYVHALHEHISTYVCSAA